MQDVAEFTGSLIAWAGELLPALHVRPAPAKIAPDGKADPATDVVLVRLASIESLNPPRSRDAIISRLRLEYCFDIVASDPVVEHQAMADLAFALLDRSDLADGYETIRGEAASLAACFAIERRRALPQPKPVREAVLDMHVNAQIHGRVQAENDRPLPKARLHVHGSDRLIIADREGAFAFAAPEGTVLRATVTAKGRAAEVELQSERPNIITLAMES